MAQETIQGIKDILEEAYDEWEDKQRSNPFETDESLSQKTGIPVDAMVRICRSLVESREIFLDGVDQGRLYAIRKPGT